jgi:hypothetical protein
MEGKCLESAYASNRVSLSCRRSPFPVIKSKFAVRLQRIPCYVAQGIYPQLSDIVFYSDIGFSSKVQKRRNSLFFSLLAGNSPDRDRFGKTTSTTTKSAQIDVISSATE